MRIRLLTLVAISELLLVAGAARAHGGGVDGYGCHNDEQSGGYHCHSGPLAGKSFRSQAEMLAALEAQQRKPSVEERLRELKDLHDKKLISDTEYAKQRDRLLGEL